MARGLGIVAHCPLVDLPKMLIYIENALWKSSFFDNKLALDFEKREGQEAGE